MALETRTLCLASALLLLSLASFGQSARRGPPPSTGGQEELGTGTVVFHQRISAIEGGFTGEIEAGDAFGRALCAIDDLDGDGRREVVVVANGDDDGGPNRGALYLLFLEPDGSVREHRKISQLEGGFETPIPDGATFGTSVASLGDVDGNGVSDLAVGAVNTRTLGFGRGAVWIVLLEADGSVLHEQMIDDANGGFDGVLDDADLFGSGVAPLGDLDGDGVPDVAVGASFDDDGGQNHGAVWILFLEADGTVGRQRKISDLAGGFGGVLVDDSLFGDSLASLGDLDGDGVVDLAVGARVDDGPGFGIGAVWIVFLRPNGTVKNEVKIGPNRGGFTGALDDLDFFGTSVAVPGDLDCDRIPDLVVGAVGDDDGDINKGALWVLFLNRDGTVREHRKISDTQGGLTTKLPRAGAFGRACAGIGDLDGDGIPDLAVGTSAIPGTDLAAGSAWILSLDGVARLDFEGGDDGERTPIANGRALVGTGVFGRTLGLGAFGAHLGPAAFDSTPLGPNDPSQDRDLLVGLGNVLILQNSLAPEQSTPGSFDRPNDDQDGGTITFDFRRPVEPFELTLVDIDHGSLQSAMVLLWDLSGGARWFQVPMGWTEDVSIDGGAGYRVLDLTTLAPQPGFDAMATASESAGFDPRSVIRLEVLLGSSGAVDDLCWDPHPDPTEPGQNPPAAKKQITAPQRLSALPADSVLAPYARR